MTRFFKRLLIVFIFIGAPLFSATAAFTPKVPAGYKVSLYATSPNARQMALSPTGLLYVGSMAAGTVNVVENGKHRTLLEKLSHPSGIVWHKGDLYIAEISRLSVIRQIDEVVKKKQKPTLIALKTDFPSDYHHGWKYLAIGPDEKIYIPVGAPCNVCPAEDPYAALHRLTLDGKKIETVARGIRNTVGFSFHPVTKQLWFTEMGRDMMGDNIPPDEINILTEGGHYGFPYLHAKTVKDPYYFGQLPPSLKPITPVAEIAAHSAPIGLRFTHNSQFTKQFPGCFFVALHGSWNRSKKVGYEVAVGCPDKTNNVASLTPFMTGLFEGQTVHARPVDLVYLKDGSLLVSDDHGGKIWRVEKVK